MFSERLKKLRKEHNLTQEQLGKKINVSKAAVSGYETGIRNPDTETLKCIASTFNVTVDYLLDRNDNRHMNSDGLTSKEDKDIKKRIDAMRADLSSSGALMFDGEPLSEDALESLMDILEHAEKTVTKVNRKYTPKKYKVEDDKNK